MQWSYDFGKIFGINFRIHVTFLLLLLFIFVSGLFQRGFEQAVRAVLFICAVFACVLIHEIGHSLIARRYGKEAKSITLLPIGGVATMEEMPEKPSQEIAMSIVGPFINLAIAAILYLFVGAWAGVGVPNLYPDSVSEFFAGLIGVNIILAIFNLIPASPMDGVYHKRLSNNKTAMIVQDGGQLKGILCLRGIGCYLMIQNALKGLEARDILLEA